MIKILLSVLLIAVSNSFSINNYYIKTNEANIDTLKISNSSYSVIISSSFDTVKTKIQGGFINNFVTTLNIYNYADSLLQSIKDTSQIFSFPEMINFVDINLDSFTDIEIRYFHERGVQYSYFWIYDTLSKRFVFAPQFELNDYSLDKGSKIISSSLYYYGCLCSTFSKFKISDNNLIQIEEEGCYKDSKGNIVSYEKGLIGNVLEIAKLDSILFIDSIITLRSYKIFNDSLLLSEVYWLSNKKVKLSDSFNSELYYESELTDLKKVIKKTLYNYKIDANGILITRINSYKVVNNKLVEIIK